MCFQVFWLFYCFFLILLIIEILVLSIKSTHVPFKNIYYYYFNLNSGFSSDLINLSPFTCAFCAIKITNIFSYIMIHLSFSNGAWEWKHPNFSNLFTKYCLVQSCKLNSYHLIWKPYRFYFYTRFYNFCMVEYYFKFWIIGWVLFVFHINIFVNNPLMKNKLLYSSWRQLVCSWQSRSEILTLKLY